MKKYICPNCESRNNRPYCNDCDCSIPNNCFIEEETDDIVLAKTYCAACGGEVRNPKQLNCPHCGELLLKGTSYKPSLSISSDQKSSTQSPIALYILSALIPIIGLIIGIIYLTKEDETNTGITCLIIGIASFLLSYGILTAM